MTKVKICGITNLEDALLSAKFGADMLGFNFYQKSPRYIAPGSSRDITQKLSHRYRMPIRAVGIFVNESIENICRIAIDTDISVIQLHGDESSEFVESAMMNTGYLSVIKAFRASDGRSIDEIENFLIREQTEYSDVAGILIDSSSPGVYGGSGAVADWEFARQATEVFPRVYLAGGLTPENVAGAIRTVQPFAVDVASGVESEPGKKDPKKLETFIKNAKNA